MFLLLISAEKDQIPVFEKKPLIWEEDMELYSKFLDRKVFITFNELVINVIYYSRWYIYIYPWSPWWNSETQYLISTWQYISLEYLWISYKEPHRINFSTSKQICDSFHSFMTQEELKADYSSYVRQHPELKALLADFLQFLLLRKPQDVFSFARDFFAPFASQSPPGKSHKDSQNFPKE